MTFKADLKFNNSKFDYTVLDCDYEFSQEIDGSMKPCAMPKIGVINVVVETKSDPEMTKWMLGAGNVRSGTITFYKDDSGSAQLKTLAFKGAICIRLQERFSSTGESPMLTYISFVANEIEVDDTSYTAQWTNF
jgi:hypothetical protein